MTTKPRSAHREAWTPAKRRAATDGRPTDDVGARRNKDQLILVSLLGGATYDEAAAFANVSERTVRPRLDDPAFLERLAAARRDAFDRETAALTAAVVDIGIGTLVRIAQDHEAPSTAQVAAARTILQEARSYNAAAVLETRLAAVESAIGGTA